MPGPVTSMYVCRKVKNSRVHLKTIKKIVHAGMSNKNKSSPVSLIVLTRSCSCAGGDPVLLPPLVWRAHFIYLFKGHSASKVVRDAVRTRPCMYTVRKEMAEDPEKREISDRRTYGHMCQSAQEWVCEQFRKTVRPGSHTAGVAGRLWSEVAA